MDLNLDFSLECQVWVFEASDWGAPFRRLIHKLCKFSLREGEWREARTCDEPGDVGFLLLIYLHVYIEGFLLFALKGGVIMDESPLEVSPLARWRPVLFRCKFVRSHFADRMVLFRSPNLRRFSNFPLKTLCVFSLYFQNGNIIATERALMVSCVLYLIYQSKRVHQHASFPKWQYRLLYRQL